MEIPVRTTVFKETGMNSRERVLTALHHRQPDRAPVDLAGHGSSGIAAIAYARLRKFLGLKKKPIRVFDPVQQLAMVDEDVLERFGVDTIDLGRAFALDDVDWADWVLPDGTPCQMPRWALPERGKDEWVIRSRSLSEIDFDSPRDKAEDCCETGACSY
jgi:uroporphyrinogen decarboxylase